MTTIRKYQLQCTTENTTKTVWSETTPTTCPTNTAHTINTNTIFVVDERKPNVVTIKEEEQPTGSNFKNTGFTISAPPNQTTIKIFKHRLPVNVLCVKVRTSTGPAGDFFRCVVAPNTTIGILATSYTAASAWADQDYVVNDVVYYEASDGGHNYKCIVNTTSHQNPSNSTYWIEVYPELTLSTAYLSKLSTGFLFHLYDGTHLVDMGQILSINTATNKITTSHASQYNFSNTTPTYIQFSVERCSRVELMDNLILNIGEDKIGGAYLPANVPIYCYYENTHQTDTHKLYFYYEYLE